MPQSNSEGESSDDNNSSSFITMMEDNDRTISSSADDAVQPSSFSTISSSPPPIINQQQGTMNPILLDSSNNNNNLLSSLSNNNNNNNNTILQTNHSDSEEDSDSDNGIIPITRLVNNNNIINNIPPHQPVNNNGMNIQTNSANIPLPTVTQRLGNLLNNRNDQDVRRQAQSIALEIIRLLFTSSIKVTIFLEYYLLAIGCLSFILLVALHTLFCIPPNNYLNAQQRIDYTRNVIMNSTESNALQFSKMMKIFASEKAQNTTKHFTAMFRLGLFGQDYHGVINTTITQNETLPIQNATLIMAEADPNNPVVSGNLLSSIENSTVATSLNQNDTIMTETTSSYQNTSTLLESTSSNSTSENVTQNNGALENSSEEKSNEEQQEDDDIIDNLFQYYEQSTFYKSIIKPLNQFFDKRFYSKPRINCLQNTILQKYRDEIINRYYDSNDTISPLAAHSYLLRTYIEGPIDKKMKSWRRELEAKNESIPLRESYESFDTIESIKYWIVTMYETSGVTEVFNDTRLFVYTTERGLFYIARESKQTLQVPVYTINLDWNEPCFDAFGGILPYILSYFIGYDTLMFNAFIQYNHDFNHAYTINSGMIYTKQFDEVYYLKHFEYDDDFVTRFFVKISPLILYVVSFVLIYYLVRTTQMNILHLIIELQAHLNSVNQILRSFLTHLFQNIMFVPVLLGVIGFIDNFFGGDQKISLMVFCLIWLAQIFLNNICSSRFSRSVFPWILHFHCGVYLTYYFRYPTGYSYFGFFVCLVLVSEMMLHFWNNYEYHHIMNYHPILRDFLGNNRANADPMLFDRLLQQNGIPVLGQPQTRVQNVQQFVFNLSDMQNQRTTIEQQIGRFNISISLAQDPNNQANAPGTNNTTTASQ
ncbi:predicted protein [Naegleria gruberi]|uniref:Predicted protein n=1 Tax=Naegleria gruberi TaxID=5762 RepID=D2VCM7_NAEGR|nr:uncharacterized protein NAEGRDRAFT_66628 [Naegleria gruberi]EFC45334.1 predicted protein [Naegleria gruberi]|eukprot:XP_002678078.1 predicted protein [Naegleria gruberi strain NEG-M]